MCEMAVTPRTAANSTRRKDRLRSFWLLRVVIRTVCGCWSTPGQTRRPGTMCVDGRCWAAAPLLALFFWLSDFSHSTPLRLFSFELVFFFFLSSIILIVFLFDVLVVFRFQISSLHLPICDFTTVSIVHCLFSDFVCCFSPFYTRHFPSYCSLLLPWSVLSIFLTRNRIFHLIWHVSLSLEPDYMSFR